MNYTTHRKHRGLPGSPTIKPLTGRRWPDTILVFTTVDPNGKRWEQLKHTLAGWERELELIEGKAKAARVRAYELLQVFGSTPSASRLVVERRLAYMAAQNDSRERNYDYEHRCDAINGAKELLSKVGKCID